MASCGAITATASSPPNSGKQAVMMATARVNFAGVMIPAERQADRCRRSEAESAFVSSVLLGAFISLRFDLFIVICAKCQLLLSGQLSAIICCGNGNVEQPTVKLFTTAER